MKTVKKYPTSAPATVAILGADSVGSDALGLLLQDAGYGTRFLTEPLEEVDGLDKQLVDVDLLILAPPLNGAYRRVLLATTLNAEAMAKIPVLELITGPASSQRAGARFLGHPVGWPCRIEDLKREIEAALLAGPLPNEPNKIG